MRVRGAWRYMTGGLALSALVVIGACASGSDDHGKGGLASHRDSAGFRLDYPRSWRPPPDGKRIAGSRFEVLVLPKGATVPDMQLDVVVQPVASTVERTVEQFITLSRASNSVSDQRLVARTKIRISGGRVGYVVEQSYRRRDDAGPLVRFRQRDLISTAGGGNSLDVRLTCRAARCRAFSAQAGAVLKSVRVP